MSVVIQSHHIPHSFIKNSKCESFLILFICGNGCSFQSSICGLLSTESKSRIKGLCLVEDISTRSMQVISMGVFSIFSRSPGLPPTQQLLPHYLSKGEACASG
jgi:hypothetical protein